MKQSFEEWFNNLKTIAIRHYGFTFQSATTFDPDSWKSYYDDGYTPAEAMKSDMLNL